MQGIEWRRRCKDDWDVLYEVHKNSIRMYAEKSQIKKPLDSTAQESIKPEGLCQRMGGETGESREAHRPPSPAYEHKRPPCKQDRRQGPTPDADPSHPHSLTSTCVPKSAFSHMETQKLRHTQNHKCPTHAQVHTSAQQSYVSLCTDFIRTVGMPCPCTVFPEKAPE